MSYLDRTHIAILIALSTALITGPTAASAVVIDSFRDGKRTIQSGGVAQSSVGRRIVDETGLANVTGGVRRVEVEASALDFPGADSVAAAIVRTPGRLSYDSSAGADGSVRLIYDRGGAGLESNLADARGIAVKIATADLAAIPCAVTLTITDRSGRSASAKQTVTDSGRTLVKFFFRSLGDIDLTAVRFIAVGIDPSVAGDVEIQWIRTFGRSHSPSGVAAERAGQPKNAPHQTSSKKAPGTP